MFLLRKKFLLSEALVCVFFPPQWPPSKDVQVLVPGTCEYVHGKRNFTDVIALRIFKRLSWITHVGPM